MYVQVEREFKAIHTAETSLRTLYRSPPYLAIDSLPPSLVPLALGWPIRMDQP